MKHLKNNFQNKKAFTLVELIVVITIVAILGMIAFISLQGYSSNARDSVRVSDLKNAELGLELFQTKTGRYPIPDSFVSYTGGTSEIKQGVLGQNVANNIKINKVLKDPLNDQKYVYSTFGNGKYYQIAADIEDFGLSFINSSYANIPKTSLVKGYYNFDPILPSLIFVSNTFTGGSIFDGNNCFVIDGGKNTLDNCVEKKNEMDFGKFDDGLVGYWDMETMTIDGKLKDLSGNENHGTGISLSGTINIGGIEGKIGNAVVFNGETDKSFFDFNSEGTTLSNIPAKGDMTIEAIVYDHETSLDNWGGIASTYQNGPAGWNFRTFCDETGKRFPEFQMVFNDEGTLNGSNIRGIPGDIEINKWYIITVKYLKNEKKSKLYLNGIELKKLSMNEIGKGNYALETYPGSDYRNNGFEIGSLGHAPVQFWNGIIDDIKIYSRALTDEEILQHAKIAGF